MQLLRARLRQIGPLDDQTFRFVDEAEGPRAMTCVVGGAGTGKSSLLSALATCRPGHAIVTSRPSPLARPHEPSWAECHWIAGDDDGTRPHPLVIVTPGAVLEGEREDRALERRREQTLFDRRAGERGFVFMAFAGCRWFGRGPVSISMPERQLGRYDVRAPASFDDATRNDLARETKQVLCAAAIGAALAKASRRPNPLTALDAALRNAVSELSSLAGYTYAGADESTFEPVFETSAGRPVLFDDLPIGVRHLVAFAALPLKALYASYSGADPLAGQGVVVIDDVELHQDAGIQRSLAGALMRALPRVQWIVTTSSHHVTEGCDPAEVIALRRMVTSGAVEVHTGSLALVH